MKWIYVEWADALTNAKWFLKDEAEMWAKESDWIIKEVGVVIDETKEYLVIAQGWKPVDQWTDEQFVNLHKIPKGWIRKRKGLKL